MVPILYLETNHDTIANDVVIPEGTPVFLLTRPSVRQGQFGAPDEFRPERWVDEERGALVHDPAAHIPFGSGPRLCPGRALATLESRVALATLFANFDVERVAGRVAERYTYDELTLQAMGHRLPRTGRARVSEVPETRIEGEALAA